MKTERHNGRCPYSVLGLTPGSSLDDIKRAYRDLALVHHPDKNMSDPTSADRFKELATAYQVLSNPERKRALDATAMAAGVRASTFARCESAFQQDLYSTRTARESHRTTGAARGAASASATRNPDAPAASQYSAEQQEIFRQRARERERELSRRREKEKQDQRDRELLRLKRQHEEKQREEERKRREAERMQERLSRIFAAGAAAEGIDGRAALGSSTAGMSSAVPTPRAPSQNRGSEEAQRHADRAERVRKERQRQDEWRRREQERALERRLEAVRAREEQRARELLEAESEAFLSRVGVVENAEAEDRSQCLVMEEAYERGLLVKAFLHIRSSHELAVKQRALCSSEQTARHEVQREQVLCTATLKLIGREGVERALLCRDAHFLCSRIILMAQREQAAVEALLSERATVLTLALTERGRITSCECAARRLVELEGSEAISRNLLCRDECANASRISTTAARLGRHLLVDNQVRFSRDAVMRQERAEWAALRFLALESACRAGMQQQANRNIARFFAQFVSDVDHEITVLRRRIASEEAGRREVLRERGELTDEVARLNRQLRQLSGELDAERGRAEAYRSHAQHESLPQPKQGLLTDGIYTAVTDDATDPREAELGALRRRLAHFEAAADNRELVALLCGENRRLLDSNARLVEENWRLARDAAAGSSSAKQRRHTPSISGDTAAQGTPSAVRARVWASPSPR